MSEKRACLIASESLGVDTVHRKEWFTSLQPSAPINNTMDHRRAHLLPHINDAIPHSPTSLALARGNFSFVHETAWSTAVYLMSLGSVVTRHRDAPILWKQMRNLRTLSPRYSSSNSRSRILRSLNSRQRVSV